MTRWMWFTSIEAGFAEATILCLVAWFGDLTRPDPCGLRITTIKPPSVSSFPRTKETWPAFLQTWNEAKYWSSVRLSYFRRVFSSTNRTRRLTAMTWTYTQSGETARRTSTWTATISRIRLTSSRSGWCWRSAAKSERWPVERKPRT